MNLMVSKNEDCRSCLKVAERVKEIVHSIDPDGEFSSSALSLGAQL